MNGARGGRGEAAIRFLLFRVDDRLLHGQVSLGWGGALGARGYFLADDLLARDAESARLYEAAAPEGCEVRVAAIEETPRSARSGDFDPGRTILLVRGLRGAASLLRAGVPGPVNLGGLHLRPGARQVRPYLFLTPEDEDLLRALAAQGHAFFAQDLPGSPRVALPDLLARDPGRSAPGGPERGADR